MASLPQFFYFPLARGTTGLSLGLPNPTLWLTRLGDEWWQKEPWFSTIMTNHGLSIYLVSPGETAPPGLFYTYLRGNLFNLFMFVFVLLSDVESNP